MEAVEELDDERRAEFLCEQWTHLHEEVPSIMNGDRARLLPADLKGQFRQRVDTYWAKVIGFEHTLTGKKSPWNKANNGAVWREMDYVYGVRNPSPTLDP